MQVNETPWFSFIFTSFLILLNWFKLTFNENWSELIPGPDFFACRELPGPKTHQKIWFSFTKPRFKAEFLLFFRLFRLGMKKWANYKYSAYICSYSTAYSFHYNWDSLIHRKRRILKRLPKD